MCASSIPSIFNISSIRQKASLVSNNNDNLVLIFTYSINLFTSSGYLNIGSITTSAPASITSLISFSVLRLIGFILTNNFEFLITFLARATSLIL